MLLLSKGIILIIVCLFTGSVDPWRLMMALKSGLLAESTWALDTLNILLYDDVTIMYFNLSHLPGLLEVLLEHFRRSLVNMFGKFEEVEIFSDKSRSSSESDDSILSDKSLDIDSDSKEKLDDNEKTEENVEEEMSEKDIKIESSKEKERGEDISMDSKSDISEEPTGAKTFGVHSNYTYITRQGVPVKMVDDPVGAGMLEPKNWDVYSGFCTKAHHFQLGGGDTSQHILTYFESQEEINISRKLFYSKRKMVYKDDDENNAENCSETETEIEDQHVTKTDEITDKDESLDTEISNEDKISEIVSEKTENSSKPLDLKSHTCNNYINRKIVVKKEIKNSDIDEKTKEPASDFKIDVKKEPDDTDNARIKQEKETEPTEVKSETEELKDENCAIEEIDTCMDEKKETDVKVEIPNKISEKTLQLITSKSDMEDEAYQKDQYPLNLISTSHDELGRRCICISNIFRSLSCVPGNDGEMSKHPGLVYILGKLLLLHHTHLPRLKVCRKLERDDELQEPIEMDQSTEEWWWDYLNALRENTLVIFANICGKLDLSAFPQEVCLPVLDGLLHWAVCPSACATDPLPTMSPNSVLSPQRLILEALCKLCIHESNVDLLLAAPPFQRIVQLFGILVKLLSNKSEPVTQEFAIVLLFELVQGDSSAARAVALQHPCISLLIDFLEAAEQKAVQVAHLHGINTLRDNPEIMGTSLDMLRRAANILLHLSQVPDNRTLFIHQQSRLLSLVMSQILDQLVAQILSDVLFQCSEEL